MSAKTLAGAGARLPAVREAFDIEPELWSFDTLLAEAGGITWRFNPLATGAWLVVREGGAYGQALEAEASQVVAAMRAMNCAAKVVDEMMRAP